MKSLPKEIAVAWQSLENDDPFLSVLPCVEDHAEMGESKIVGVYKLEKVVRVSGRAIVSER